MSAVGEESQKSSCLIVKDIWHLLGISAVTFLLRNTNRHADRNAQAKYTLTFSLSRHMASTL